MLRIISLNASLGWILQPDQPGLVAENHGGEFCRSEDVSNAVLFLAADEVSGHITGQVLSVSGGYSMVG